ncbi:DUF4442 domain-containing protein [Algicola sagamiensis]|uniref:DUF4442 domain-containing protein n=1 Tax=Algicola sagamiensis TaxID=163869 RepID=UPI0003AB37AE|nr:DUF4442 domain-containing protein [Algicola sagamiensis]
MSQKNRLAKATSFISRLPQKWQSFLLSQLFNRQVKFAGTAGIRVMSLSNDGCHLQLNNKKRVQNHIGSVHAAATALLAESASGIAFGYHVPDDKIPLLKTMHINYVKRSSGNLTAQAQLTPEQIEQVTSQEKGDISVRVTVTDEADIQPVEITMEWAWIPKKRKS